MIEPRWSVSLGVSPLDGITVQLAGKKLVYKTPFGSTSSTAFKPAERC